MQERQPARATETGTLEIDVPEGFGFCEGRQGPDNLHCTLGIYAVSSKAVLMNPSHTLRPSARKDTAGETGFGLELRDEDGAVFVYVPQEIQEGLSQIRVWTAEDLIRRLSTFPTVIARALGWTVEDVIAAQSEANVILRDVVSKECFRVPEQRDRIYGALRPNTPKN